MHTLLRMIIPKGTVFTHLTQWDIKLAVNHINSTPRLNLHDATPYQSALDGMAKMFSKHYSSSQYRRMT